ncbi:carboxylesterase/lipase family protein [Chelativorans alearense]|uniref:carboxylesterase/lipase family protein n=1 Tax=Chelativorans alearense TaxID=2681495 RepID=UPI0013D3AC49|nr:carboxylesterase family protein [Chelativorans alearense]
MVTSKASTCRSLAWSLLAGCLLLSTAVPAALADPVDVVEIAGGKVKGVETDVPGIQLFKGIPFAAQTSGANRWKPPQPVEPWEGVTVADRWPDQVVQDINLNPVGKFWGDEFYYDREFLPPASEDSLKLNLYTPAASTDDNLPVYVWIHGGGNDHGYASEIEFWASKLAEKGVIVVQTQYRVGPLGFLALDELSKESPNGASGNYALLDLVATLQWVQDNIQGFGGDPNRVTIGGQSAGGRNSITLLKSPLAKGLFHRAVIQSGFGGILPLDFKTLEQAEADNAAALEEIFGKPMSLGDLRALPTTEFTQKMVGDDILYKALDRAIGEYIIDGYSLTQESIDLLRPGALDGIDIMIGGTSDERTSQRGGPDRTFTDDEFDAAMTKIYGNDAYAEIYEPSDPREAYRMSLRADTDFEFQKALISAQYAKAHNDSNVFAYYFNQVPPGRDSEFYGAYHSADLWYFFNSLREWPGQRHWTDADYRMADTISSYLANFIKTGDPNGENLPEWPQPMDGPAFMRFADGYAQAVESTPYPSRDALNRKAVFDRFEVSEGDLSQ